MDTSDIILSGSQLKKLVEHLSAPLIEKYNLRYVELDILVFLYRSQNTDTAKEILKSRHISKAHISKSIEHLHAKGYVTLDEDMKDHRMVHIILTQKACTLVEEAMEIYKECKEIMFQNITEQEIQIMQTVTKKIMENVNMILQE